MKYTFNIIITDTTKVFFNLFTKEVDKVLFKYHTAIADLELVSLLAEKELQNLYPEGAVAEILTECGGVVDVRAKGKPVSKKSVSKMITRHLEEYRQELMMDTLAYRRVDSQ